MTIEMQEPFDPEGEEDANVDRWLSTLHRLGEICWVDDGGAVIYYAG